MDKANSGCFAIDSVVFNCLFFLTLNITKNYSTKVIGTQISEILQLSAAERIQLVEDIWDSIDAIPEAVTLSTKQAEELETRINAYRSNPTEGISWKDLKNKFHDQV